MSEHWLSHVLREKPLVLRVKDLRPMHHIGAEELDRLQDLNNDLLEALKTLLDRVDQINMTTSQIQYWADYQALARGAIAKATGNDARPVGESQ